MTEKIVFDIENIYVMDHCQLL